MTEVNTRFAVLGAGIAGLATSYHLDHRDTVVFEASATYGGHAAVRDT